MYAGAVLDFFETRNTGVAMEKKLESNRAMMEYVGAFIGLLVVIIIAVSVVISRFSCDENLEAKFRLC